LFFPKDKVVSSAHDQVKARVLMKAREGTSIKKVKKFAQVNHAFKPALEFTLHLAKSSFPELEEILKELRDEI